MPRLKRKNIKVFAGSATNNGVFGSLQANNPTTTSDVELLQSLPAWSEGWNAATETSEELPPLEEIQGVEYVTTYQQAYIMQEGIPEWASTVTYYKGCLAKEVTANGFRIYNSLTNNNKNHLLSDTSNWKKVMDSDDLYAFDNTVVHKTGDETIAGIKTFNGEIDIGAGEYKKSIYRQSNGNFAISMNNQDNSGWMSYIKMSTAGRVVINAGDATATDRVIALQGNSATAPTPTDTTTTSGSQIATTGWVNKVGNNVIHKTGNETITGSKTFTSNQYIKNVDCSIANPPASTSWKYIDCIDSNNVRIGVIGSQINTDGTRGVYLQAGNEGGISVFTNGTTVYTSTVTPPASDNSTKIATTRWVNSTGNNVVHKTGDETIGGDKTFNNRIHFNNSVYVDAAAGDEGGEIEFAKAPNSSLTGNVKLDVFQNSMRIFGPASNGQINNVMRADIEQNALFIPGSDKTDSAISTIGINKSSNGYVKLGNGIIIQWGKSTATSSSGYVTLPTPFASTNYAVIINNVMENVPSSQPSTANLVGWGVIQSRSTTSFTAFLCNYENSSWWRWGEGRSFTWIAIGY